MNRRDLILSTVAVGLAGAGRALAQAPAGVQGSSAQAWVWDLAEQYPDQAAWDADLAWIEARLAALPALRGTAGRGGGELLTVLDAIRDLRGRAGHMARYAVLARNLAASSDAAAARLDAATALEHRVDLVLAPLIHDVATVERAKVAAWRAAEPRLEAHRLRLHRIFREARWTAPEGEEALLIQLDRWPRSSSVIYDALGQVDVKWPSISLADGTAVVADADAFNRLRRSPDAGARRAVARAHLGRLREFENVYGLLYGRRIEGDMIAARRRGYANLIDAAFDINEAIPPGAAAAMIQAAQAGRPLLARWAAAMAKLQSLPRVEFADVLARPLRYDRRVPIEEAAELCAAAFAPMGRAYVARMRERWRQRQLHLPPAPDKSSEVGVWWQVGGGHPLGMMTYNDDVLSAGMFCRVTGGMMWYGDIPPELAPDVREDDPAVQGNGHWYMSQFLFDDRFTPTVKEPAARAVLLNNQLALLYRNFYEPLMGAELELQVTAEVARGVTPSGGQISERYLALLRHYLDGVQVEEHFGGLWMLQGQGFYGEVLPGFAMAVSVGAALAEAVGRGDRRAILGIQATSAGDSQYSYDLLTQAGLDVADPAMHKAMLRRFERLLSEFEQLVANGLRAP
jgi:oligoendopeptidase F